MSLLVHVWVPDHANPGTSRILDTPEGASDLAGFERTRTELWGSAAARGLGATFLPQLAGADLWVVPAEVGDFAAECAMLLADLPLLSSATGFDEDYIRVRLTHIAQAADRAAQVNGGVLIW